MREQDEEQILWPEALLGCVLAVLLLTVCSCAFTALTCALLVAAEVGL